MDRTFIQIGCWLAFFGVAVGAFGAHALAARLTPELMSVYQVGVQYHLIHALGVFAVGLLLRDSNVTRPCVIAGWLMAGGVLLFSGSLYLLAVFELRAIARVTPFGGILLLCAWALLAVAVGRRNVGD